MRRVDLGVTEESVVTTGLSPDATANCWVRAGVVAGTDAEAVLPLLHALVQQLNSLAVTFGPTPALVSTVELQLIRMDVPSTVYEIEVRLTIRGKLYRFWAFPED